MDADEVACQLTRQCRAVAEALLNCKCWMGKLCVVLRVVRVPKRPQKMSKALWAGASVAEVETWRRITRAKLTGVFYHSWGLACE
jgi:hypothetical protein